MMGIDVGWAIREGRQCARAVDEWLMGRSDFPWQGTDRRSRPGKSVLRAAFFVTASAGSRVGSMTRRGAGRSPDGESQRAARSRPA